MKPIEETKTITVFKCADCDKEHSDSPRAELCCACTLCEGPTTAEDKKIARGGSQFGGFYRRDLACEWCRARKAVKVTQDRMRTVEAHVKEAERRLEGAKRELANTEAELSALVTKRDALPPKPRVKKESAA